MKFHEIKDLVDLYKYACNFAMLIRDTHCELTDLEYLIAINPELKNSIDTLKDWASDNDPTPNCDDDNEITDDRHKIEVKEVSVLQNLEMSFPDSDDEGSKDETPDVSKVRSSEEDETTNPLTNITPPLPNKNLDKSFITNLAMFIAKEYNGTALIDVVSDVVNMYPQFDHRTLWRMISKRTFKRITDKFYDIDKKTVSEPLNPNKQTYKIPNEFIGDLIK